MKELPLAGTLVRFEANGKELIGYVTGRDENTDTVRVCTRPGVYYSVDRATATIV